jgi:hypothetical protein
MNAQQTAAVREKICMAMSDIGGVCERLRDFDSGDVRDIVAEDMKREMQEWLDQAAETLQEAALVISGEVVPL